MQVARQALPQLMPLRKRALIVSDRVEVHVRAENALRPLFKKLLNAESIESARQIIRDQEERDKDPHKPCDPIDLLCSSSPLFVVPANALFTKFHASYPNVPIILYSGTATTEEKAAADFFVPETWNFDPRFDVDQALLRATALEALGVPHNISVTTILSQATERPRIHPLEDLDLPMIIIHYVREARRSRLERKRALLRSGINEDEAHKPSQKLASELLDIISPLFAFARVSPEIVTEEILLKLISHIMAPELPIREPVPFRIRA